MTLYEQSDFLNEDETIQEYRARVLPRRPVDRIALALVVASIVTSIMVAFALAALVATVAP